jgi:hypothetical protein
VVRGCGRLERVSDDGRARYDTFFFDSARWEGFELRADDIIISTPPKCGTTWTQMIVALLVFQTPELPAPLAELSPWFDMRTRARRDVVAALDAQTHRRFIKTHTPRDGLPEADGVTYLCVGRDPRDVALSMIDHRLNIDLDVVEAANIEAARIDGTGPPPPRAPTPLDVGQTVDEKFWWWVADDTPPTRAASSLRSTLAHEQSFWSVRDRPDVVMLHYHDLGVDCEGEMRRLADRLGITVPEARWPALVAAASFESMRDHARERSPNTDSGIWRDDAAFFRKARSGAWREVLVTDDDRARYDARAARLAPSDLLAWLHRS